MRSRIFTTILPAVVVTVLFPTHVLALDNGLAITPQMGWNTYYHYGCNFNEQIVVDVANAMISNNLTALGYNYVLLDDCWQAPARDPDTGAPVEDPNKFPNGMKALADKIHGLGLKFGIYSDAGTYTCGRSFGSLGYEEIDAKTYASWGVDYLKYDNCYNEGLAGTPKISYDRFANMSRALNATGRPILYSMCNWGEDGPWNFAVDIANSWRISGDLVDEFDRFDDRCPCTDILDCKLPGFHCAMARVLDFAAPVGQKAGAGRWNDLDILQVGLGGMSFDEYVTHFTMWSLVKSPLIIGTDIMNMSNETRTILTNEALLGVNQDSAGSPANRIWKRPIEAGGNLGRRTSNSHTYCMISGRRTTTVIGGRASGRFRVPCLMCDWLATRRRCGRPSRCRVVRDRMETCSTSTCRSSAQLINFQNASHSASSARSMTRE
ncbi:glycoside hydrolase superfamily [Trametes maxima]|nr:glycoside hydrolase superfamily [Trametes maxima]